MNHVIKIGGVRLGMQCNSGIDLLIQDPVYDEFLTRGIGGQDGPADISLDISFGRIHDLKNLRDCFETGQSWSLFRDGDDYLLKFQREGLGEPYMTARMSSDISKVELFCSGDFINDEGKAVSPVHYPLDQILLIQYLFKHEGFIAHSAGTAVDGKGYMFPGCSGAGKTTISRSLALSDKGMLLSDDRIIIRKEADNFMIYGTPWPGEAGIAKNKSVPLKGIFFLEKGSENRIMQIEGAEALRRFMPVLSVPWYDRDAITMTFSLVGELISLVPSYVLQFKPGEEVVDIFEKFISA